MELVSFLVPVYNVEKFLPKCLDSLLEQTYSNIEIVCINDGSTDNSLSILETYRAKDSRIKIYSYENSGISKTRNRSLKHMTGDFCMFVDSDDFIEKDTVEKMMDKVWQDKADLVMCGFVMDFPFFKFYRRVAKNGTWTNTEALKNMVENKGINNYPWGKLFKASLFENVSFPEDQRGFEDTYTIFKAIAKANKIVTMPNRFYHYVQRRGSLTNNMSLDTVMHMRQAYHYQQNELHKMFPTIYFDYTIPFYNTDMVIIYTLLLFCSKKDDPHFEMDTIDFNKLAWYMRFAYKAWLQIACWKFGWSRKEIERENKYGA